MEHGGVEYCCQCREYPCEKYEHIDDFDSFITHRNRRTDLEKVRQFGAEAYNTEQMEKIKILDMEILTLKEKSAFATEVLSEIASRRKVDLKLHRKK